jgi:hypothetical protein
MIHSEDAPALETELHKQFSDAQVNKVNSRKEFFRVPLLAVREVVNSMGIEAHWTLKAEAMEYRETMALERARAKQEGEAKPIQAGVIENSELGMMDSAHVEGGPSPELG